MPSKLRFFVEINAHVYIGSRALMQARDRLARCGVKPSRNPVEMLNQFFRYWSCDSKQVRVWRERKGCKRGKSAYLLLLKQRGLLMGRRRRREG